MKERENGWDWEWSWRILPFNYAEYLLISSSMIHNGWIHDSIMNHLMNRTTTLGLTVNCDVVSSDHWSEYRSHRLFSSSAWVNIPFLCTKRLLFDKCFLPPPNQKRRLVERTILSVPSTFVLNCVSTCIHSDTPQMFIIQSQNTRNISLLWATCITKWKTSFF